MKDEIKHIKVLLENHVALSDNEDKLLLDYITNLQEENEKAILMLEELNVKLKDILKIEIDIKEITDIKNLLQGEQNE